MVSRVLVLLLTFSLVAPAAAKKAVATARGENQDLVLNVTLYADPEAVKGVLGSDLDGHFTVAEVRVEPKYGKQISVYRDDFVLRTDKDGEKGTPFAPSQIAGRGALVVSRTGGGGGMMGESGDPRWSGSGPFGGGSFGAGGSSEAVGATATMKSDGAETDNPLLKLLEAKVLPEKKTAEPVSGLLYFGLEKQKIKDLELTYGGRENRISMRFK